MTDADAFAPADTAAPGTAPAGDTSGYGEVVTYASAAALDSHEAAVASIATVDRDLADALAKSWGSDLRTNLSFASRAADALRTPELVDAIERAGLGNSPHLVRALAAIGRQMAAVAGDPASIPSPAEIVAMTTAPAPSTPAGTEGAIRDLKAMQREQRQRVANGTVDQDFQDDLAAAYRRAYPEQIPVSHISPSEAARLDREIAAMRAKQGTDEWGNIAFQDRLAALYRQRWNGPSA